MTLDDLWGHTSIPTEKLGVKQKIYRKKFYDYLMWTLMTSVIILYEIFASS